jgi:PAS domain S-box-containing protein
VESQEASGDALLKARIAELEAENARLRSARSDGPDIRGVADALPVLIAYVDREHRYQFNNKVYEDVFGLTVEQLLGQHVRDVVGAEAFAELEPIVERVLAGERVSTELLVPLAQGPRHVAIDYVPDSRGDKVVGYFSLARDISERKEAEARLRESEARFRAMADSAPVPAWVTDEQGIEFVNQAMVEFAGVERAEVLGHGWTALIHPDDLPEVQRIRSDSWDRRVPYSFEARFRRADGAWRWLLVSSRPRQDIDGDRRGYVGMAVDLTDMHSATAALRESEERYRSLFSSIDAGFCIVEVEFAPSGQAIDYRFIEVNPAFEQQTGLSGAAGKRMRELAPGHEQHWFDLYGDVAKTGRPRRFEHQATALGDRWFDVYAYRTGPADSHRVAILFNDVTARRRAERALTELNQSLEQRIEAAIAERQRMEEALRQSQ